MSEILEVVGIQSELFWEDVDRNLDHFTKKLDTISNADLIVLPEMFSTGFTMNPEKVAETMQGKSVYWMVQQAQKKAVAITGSLVIKEKESFYNRSVFVFPDGSVQYYDKRHLFTLAGEQEKYTSGSNKLVVTYKGWEICPLICYDLRFPVWSRNTENYDVLLYVANWPQPRITAWDTLLRARAIENLCYSVGVNRVGVDDNEHKYSGHSTIINPVGEILSELPENEEGIIKATFRKSELKEIRNKLGFLNDKDQFTIKQ